MRTAQQLLNQAHAVADVCRSLEVSPAIYHRWQQLYGGMQTKLAGSHELVRQNASSRKASPKEQELEQENSRLKRLLADAKLDKAMLQQLASAKQYEVFLRRQEPVARCAAIRKR